jgi:5-methylcytosine-specific restriction endonuclease McrA
VLRARRGEHGNWCPGYQRDAHAASDLTVDHVVPLAAGGAPFDIRDCAVLCRSCNATKGAGVGDRGVPTRRFLAPRRPITCKCRRSIELLPDPADHPALQIEPTAT